MNVRFKELKSIRAKKCITIIMTTHRTKPDYLQDSLRLKNLIKEVETRLLADVGKKEAGVLLKRVDDLANKIDHSQNLDSLVIFVNEDVAEYMRLPIKVADRVVIDETFATRDLVRALHLETQYFILVVSQENVRMVEAVSANSVREISGEFPFENTDFRITNRTVQGDSSKQTNLIAEYFNLADKRMNAVRKENPLSVLLCGLEENINQYMAVADNTDAFLPVRLNKGMINEPTHAIVEEAWKVLKDHVAQENNARKEALRKAVGANTFLSDSNDIWRAIQEGRVRTLYVEQGLFQPAVLTEDNQIEYVSEERRNDTGVIDDIYDEMIEINMDFGGDVVFLPKGELDKFNGFGAITRY